MWSQSDSDNQTRGQSSKFWAQKLHAKKRQTVEVNGKSEEKLKVGESEGEEVESLKTSQRGRDKGWRWTSSCQEGEEP